MNDEHGSLGSGVGLGVFKESNLIRFDLIFLVLVVMWRENDSLERKFKRNLRFVLPVLAMELAWATALVSAEKKNKTQIKNFISLTLYEQK